MKTSGRGLHPVQAALFCGPDGFHEHAIRKAIWGHSHPKIKTKDTREIRPIHLGGLVDPAIPPFPLAALRTAQVRVITPIHLSVTEHFSTKHTIPSVLFSEGCCVERRGD